MAIDNTPPRLKLITTIAIIVVVTLIGLDFVFRSYYAYMSDEAAREKIAPPKALESQLAAEKQALANAALPIDKAMAELAKEGRSALIAPTPSEDLGPMTGWVKMPKAAPTVPQGGPAPAAPREATDAGAAEAADAGATPTQAPAPAPTQAPAPAADAGAHP